MSRWKERETERRLTREEEERWYALAMHVVLKHPEGAPDTGEVILARAVLKLLKVKQVTDEWTQYVLDQHLEELQERKRLARIVGAMGWTMKR